MTIWVKVCGITSVEDAELVAATGVNALGLNFVPGSKRFIDVATAKRIVEAVSGAVELIGVVANSSQEELARLRGETGIETLQLHGDEAPALLTALGGDAFKALRIGTPADVAEAKHYPGERLLVDAKVSGSLGGTGAVLDWSLVTGLSAARKLILAGGLNPDNVAQAISRVRPWGVDVASGVEKTSRAQAQGASEHASERKPRKDLDKVRAFLRAARLASVEGTPS